MLLIFYRWAIAMADLGFTESIKTPQSYKMQTGYNADVPEWTTEMEMLRYGRQRQLISQNRSNMGYMGIKTLMDVSESLENASDFNQAFIAEMIL